MSLIVCVPWDRFHEERWWQSEIIRHDLIDFIRFYLNFSRICETWRIFFHFAIVFLLQYSFTCLLCHEINVNICPKRNHVNACALFATPRSWTEVPCKCYIFDSRTLTLLWRAKNLRTFCTFNGYLTAIARRLCTIFYFTQCKFSMPHYVHSQYDTYYNFLQISTYIFNTSCLLYTSDAADE